MKKKKNKKVIIYIFLLIISVFILFCFLINDNNKNFLILTDVKNITANISGIGRKSANKDVINEIDNDYKKEIDNLKNTLKLNKLNSDKKLINSIVIKRSTNYWYDVITIDKGKKDNIKVGLAAINSNGLIGRVINVTNNSSDIKLLTNSKYKNYISVKFEYDNNEYYGLINGYDYKNNELSLINVIGSFDKEKIKDINVTTSGLSDLFSSGLLVGKINEIKKDKFGISNIIKIKPSVDFNELNIITIVGDK